MTEWYEPKPVIQLDGSKCQGANCWAASGAWQLSAATGGAAVITPTVFRQRAGGGSGKANDAGCPSGFEVDLVAGLDKMGVRSSIIRVTEARARRILSTERAAAFAVATDYEVWPEDQKAAAPGFDGNHMVGVIPGLGAAKRVQVMNPLASAYQRIDLEVLLDAAVKFSKEHARGGLIWLVRIYRPEVVPDGASDDRKALALARRTIEELRDDLDDAHDRAAADVALLAKYDREDGKL